MGARQLASKPTEARDSPQVSVKSSGPPSKPIRLTRQRKLRYEFLTPSQQPKSLTLSRYNFFFFFPFFFLSFFLFIYLWISCRWLNLTWISFSFIRRLLSLSLCLWLSFPFQNHFPFSDFSFYFIFYWTFGATVMRRVRFHGDISRYGCCYSGQQLGGLIEPAIWSDRWGE